MELGEAIEQFLVAGRQAGYSRETIKSYGSHLRRLKQWLAEHEIERVEELTRPIVREWGAAIREDWQATTTRGAITSARSCFQWLHREEMLDADLATALKIPRVPDKAQRTLSVNELNKLLTVCEVPAERGLTEHQAFAATVRNAAILTLLFDSMIRSCELVALKVEDVDTDAKQVIVRAGKGGKGRVGVFGPVTAEALRVWLQARDAAPGVTELFVGIGGLTPRQPMTTSGLRVTLRRLGERAGLEGISPHAFRRGGAATATLRGAPSRLVQVWGGWSNIRMVELYTRMLQMDPEVVAVFQRYSPVSLASDQRKAAHGRNGTA
jgi:site-specific recombinase XerD